MFVLPHPLHTLVIMFCRFGGQADGHRSNDTWSFDISTRKWTELQCTGSIPSPRSRHAAVLVGGVMYVFGGYSGNGDLDDLYALQLSSEWLIMLIRYLVHMRNAAQRWFKFPNVGPSPHKRSGHAMASDGTRVFVLGGILPDARAAAGISLIHVFDTSMFFRSLISSGLTPRLGTQRTSSSQIPSLTLSILTRRPPNLRGSHPHVSRPWGIHSTR